MVYLVLWTTRKNFELVLVERRGHYDNQTAIHFLLMEGEDG